MNSPDKLAILAAREAAGLTQVQAARLIGSGQVTWARYESGTRPMPARLWRLWLHLAGLERLPFRKPRKRA